MLPSPGHRKGKALGGEGQRLVGEEKGTILIGNFRRKRRISLDSRGEVATGKRLNYRNREKKTTEAHMDGQTLVTLRRIRKKMESNGSD